MSSMRNAVQRRNHKERAQPTERSKWGILEKHRDYSLRAKDHNEKKKRIKILRQKATDRNPDEFAFGMTSSSTKGGIKVSQRGKENGSAGSMSLDMVKLLKTQDLGYVQMVLQQTRREKDRVAEDAVLAGVNIGADGNGIGRKTTFDDDGNAVSILNGDEDVLNDLDDLADLDGLDGDMEMDEGKKKDDESKLSPEELKVKRKRERVQEVLSRKLKALQDRESTLAGALEELQEQRAKMSNTTGGVNKRGIKFKLRERKK